ILAHSFLALFFLALTIAAFGPSIHVPWMWDDGVLLLNNPRLQSTSVSALQQDFTAPSYPEASNYYRPVQLMVLRGLWHFFGKEPLGYHVTSLLLLAGCAWLVASIGMTFGLSTAAAVLAGALVAVHPIIVDEMLPAT